MKTYINVMKQYGKVVTEPKKISAFERAMFAEGGAPTGNGNACSPTADRQPGEGGNCGGGGGAQKLIPSNIVNEESDSKLKADLVQSKIDNEELKKKYLDVLPDGPEKEAVKKELEILNEGNISGNVGEALYRYYSENGVPEPTDEQVLKNVKTLKDQYNIDAQYGELDAETTDIFTKGIAGTIDDFPMIKDKLAYFNVTGPNKELARSAYGAVRTYGDGRQTLFMNPNIKNMSKNMKYEVETKYHPEGTDNIKSSLDHEMAHSISKNYGIVNDPDLQSYFAMSPDEVKNNLSEYAATNKEELIAEAWSEYKNNPNPRPMAKNIGQIIEKYKGK